MNKKLEETLDKDPAGITINSFQKLLDKTKKRNEFGQKIKKFYAYGNSLNRNETKIFDVSTIYVHFPCTMFSVYTPWSHYIIHNILSCWFLVIKAILLSIII